jgi:hypothetical protein
MSHPGARLNAPAFSSPYHHPSNDHPSESSDSEHDADIWDQPRDATTAFLHVLTAPYSFPAPAPPILSSAIDTRAVQKSFAAVDWSAVPPNDSGYDSSEDEENVPLRVGTKFMPVSPEDAEIVPCRDDQERDIYPPHEKWGWTKGLAIEDPEILMYLGGKVSNPPL